MRIPIITSWLNRRDMRDTSLAMVVQSNGQLHDDVTELTRQVRALVELNQRKENLVMAATDVAEGFNDAWLARGAAPHFSESELQPLLRLFHAAGRFEAAEMWAKENDTPDPDPFKGQARTELNNA